MRRRRILRHSQSGLALVAVLLVLSLLMTLSLALTTSINMDSALRGAYDRVTEGFYAAESGLNRGMGDYRNIFLNFNVPTGSDFAAHTISVGKRTVNYQITDVTAYDALHNPPSITIPAGQLFGGLNSIEYDYIASSSAAYNNATESSVNAEFKVGNIPVFQFVAFYKRDLEIAPGANMTLNGRVHTNGDLYLDADNSTLLVGDNPPTITTIQVSSAGNIYRGRKRQSVCETGTVTVDMLQDTSPKDGRLDPQNLNCSGSATRLVPASELATWKGSMFSQVESIAVPEPGTLARCTDTNQCRFWSKADLRIVLNMNNVFAPVAPLTGPATQYSIEVQNVDGTLDVARTAILRTFMQDTNWNTNSSSFKGTRPIFYTDVPTKVAGGANNCTCTDANATGCSSGIAGCYNPTFANAPANAVSTQAQNNRVYATGTTMTAGVTDADYRRGGFYNWREHKWLYLLNVNVRDLLAWNQAQYTANPANALFSPTDRSDGGIVLFLSVQGPESTLAANHYGVRVFGSQTLPFPNMGADPTGITIASDQAIYVLGNYNSNANTIANGKQPAALVGDSINVLSSNYWSTANPPAQGSLTNDAQSNLSLGTAARTAAATTINAAFLGGVDDTVANGGAAGYNGGLENYPRFHESWSGVNFTYLGSFVSLGLPQHVNGQWCGTGNGCNIYNPPVRVWNYDGDFNNAAYLPPLTPSFVYVQQVLFTENFK